MNKILKFIGIVMVMALVFCTCALCLVGCNNNEGLIVEPNEEPDDVIESGLQFEYEANTDLGLSIQEIAPEDYEDYGVSMASESAYTLTATVTPSDCLNKNVVWSIAFKNPSSTWANGKSVTNYVTIDSSLNSAVVSCILEFGEQIIITATSEMNPNLSVSCTCDYLRKVTNVSGYYSSSKGLSTSNNGLSQMHILDDADTYTFNPIIIGSSSYTKDNLETSVSWSLSTQSKGIFGSDAQNIIRNSLSSYSSYNISMISNPVSHSEKTVELSLDFLCEELFGKYFTNPTSAIGSSVNSDSVKNVIRYAVYQGLYYTYNRNPGYILDVVYTCGDYTSQSSIAIGSLDVSVPALSVNLNKTLIEF